MGWGLSSTGDIFPPAKDKNILCYSEGLLLKYKSYRKNIEARRQSPAYKHLVARHQDTLKGFESIQKPIIFGHEIVVAIFLLKHSVRSGGSTRVLTNFKDKIILSINGKGGRLLIP